jgi:CRISPR-associated protein Cas2
VKVLISYDITSDEKRRKVAAILENILPRVQYSVFEGEAPDEVIPTTVKKALRHLEPETDSLRVYRLCESCVKKVEVHGKKLLTDVPPVRIL